MKQEELKQNAQKMLELKEPFFVEKLAPKLKNYAQIIYLVGLVLLAISVLGGIIMLFSSPSAAIISLLFVVVEFILLRMFCEFLISYNK